MNLPYVSQLEENGLGYDNCGPAGLTAGLAALGIGDGSHDRLHAVAEQVRGAPWDANTFTSFDQLQRAATALGATPAYLSDWDTVFAALDAQQPVMLLVDNRFLLPRQYPATPAFNARHFLCLGGYDAEQFSPVCDPLAVYTRDLVTYDGKSVRAGVAAVGGVQALALSVAAPTPTDAPAPPGGVSLVTLTDAQRAALDKLAELSWGADSIVTAIEKIGALENVRIPQLEAQVADLQERLTAAQTEAGRTPELEQRALHATELLKQAAALLTGTA